MEGALLLDLDGTLIDSRADLALALNLTRADLGLPAIPEAEVVRDLGEPVGVRVARAFPGRPELLEEALRLHQKHYLAHLLDRTCLYPGVETALARFCDQGRPLMVVTNKARVPTERILEGLGVRKRFQVVVGAGDGPALKPDPAPLLFALARGGCSREGAWMVGDHVADLESGRRAGLKRCFCRYGFGAPGPEGWDLAVEALMELADHLENPRTD